MVRDLAAAAEHNFDSVPYVTSARPLRDLRMQLEEKRCRYAPGPWLRLTALAASAATLLAVVSGAAGLGTAHRVLAALALPPLAALLVAAWIRAPRLFLGRRSRPSVCSASAALVTARGAHLALAALAFAATLVVTALVHRTARVPLRPRGATT